MATIDVCYSLSLTGRRVTKQFRVVKPISIEELLTPVTKDAREQVSVVFNGEQISQDQWKDTMLEDSSVVQLIARVHGGGDSNEVGVILTIAVLIAAAATGNYLVTQLGWEAWKAAAVQTLISVGGVLVVNHLFPPRLPSLTEQAGIDQEQQFSLRAGNNPVRRHQSAILVLGKHRVFPEFAGTPYAEIEQTGSRFDPTAAVEDAYRYRSLDYNDDLADLAEGRWGHDDDVYDADGNRVGTNVQILFQLFDWGLGTLQITDRRLGQTPIGEYDDVERDTEKPITLVNSNVDTAEGITYTEDHNEFTTTIPAGTYRVGVNLVSQSFMSTEEGQIQPQTNTFRIDIEQAGETTHTQSVSIHGASGARSRLVVRRSVYINLPSRFEPDAMAPVNLVVTRTTLPDPENERATNNASVFSVNFYQNEQPDWTGRNPEALKIRATGQLNGTVDNFNGLVGQIIPVRQADGTFADAVSSNPAWIIRKFWIGFYAQRGDENVLIAGRGYAADTIDDDNLAGFAAFCDANGLTCNAYIDASHMTENEIEEAILACGWASYDSSNGKHAVLWDRADVPVTAIFGTHNVLTNSVQVTYSGEPLADIIEGTYIDETQDYERNTIRRRVPSEKVEGKPVRVNLTWITNPAHAARELNRIAAAQFYHNKTISFQASLDAGQAFLARGDVIALGHDLVGGTISTRFANLAVTNFTYFQLEMPLGEDRLRACLYLYDTDGVVQGPYYFQQLRSDDNGASLGFDVSKVWGLLYVDKLFSSIARVDDLLKDGLDGDTDLDRLKRYRVVVHDISADLLKVKVVGIRPGQDNTFTVNCRPEVPEYYGHLHADLTYPLLPTRLRYRPTRRGVNELGGDGIAGIGVERIYSGAAAGYELVDADLPDNLWGYADGGVTSNGRVWSSMPVTLTEQNRWIYQSERMVLGVPMAGAEVADLWSTPVRVVEAGDSVFIESVEVVGGNTLIRFSDGSPPVILPPGQSAGNITNVTRDEEGYITFTFSDGTNWRVFVSDGEDGRYQEFIYIRTQGLEPPTDTPASDPNLNDYVPTGYTDDPVPPDANFRRSWVRRRRFNRTTGRWAAWGEPVYYSAFIPDILGQVEYWMIGETYAAGYLVGHLQSVTIGSETFTVIRAWQARVQHTATASNAPPNPNFWVDPLAGDGVAPGAMASFQILKQGTLLLQGMYEPPTVGTPPFTFRQQWGTDATFADLDGDETTSATTAWLGADYLQHGMTYYFRVRAENQYGVGPWADTSYTTEVAVGIKPGPPIDLAYTEVESTASPTLFPLRRVLSWNHGDPLGTAPVMFQVRISTNFEFTPNVTNLPPVTALSTDITGATRAGDTYYAQVKAVNDFGESDWSTAIPFTTSGGMGLQITNYVLDESVPGSGSVWQGIQYRASGFVWALRSDGQYEPIHTTSDWIRPIEHTNNYEIRFTTSASAQVQTGFQGEVGFGTWYGLESDRQLYRVVPVNSSALDVTVEIREKADHTNIASGVVSFQQAGFSIPAAAPDPPANIRWQTPSPGSLVGLLFYDIPADALSVRVQVARDAQYADLAFDEGVQSTWGAEFPAYGSYYARVRSHTSNGVSLWAEASNNPLVLTDTAPPPVQVPGVPQVSHTPYNGGVTISFRPGSSGGTPTAYDLQFRRSGTSVWMDTDDQAAQGVPTVINYDNNGTFPHGTTVQYRVRARNSAGYGAWSGSPYPSFVLQDQTTTPPEQLTPGVPSIQATDIGTDYATFRITAGSGATPTSYGLNGGQAADPAGWIIVEPIPGPVYTATGLQPDTRYGIRVRASANGQTSAWSAIIYLTTEADDSGSEDG